MNHLALGAALPFAVATMIYFCRGRRASLTMLFTVPLAMLACALWAVAPDIPRLTGHYELYARLARDPRTDVFFWHYTIDCLESESSWPAAALLVMTGCLLLAAWRELRIAEAE